MTEKTILKIDRVSKSFPGVKALDEVSFELKEGEVHAVVGENGAGKSTLMHILAGVYKPDSGHMCIDGREIVLESARDAYANGIGIIFQELSLVDSLSIAENIYANQQPVKWMGRVDWDRLYRKTREMLMLFDLQHIDPRTPVKRLPPALRQSVEILKSLSMHPKILILDEPTSSLTIAETHKLYENIRKLKKQGVSCIYISHHLSEIFEIADRVTVLKDGRNVTTKPIEGVTENQVVSYMVGRELKNIYGKKDETPHEKAAEGGFTVRGLNLKGCFTDVSFHIEAGEIVSVTGLMGSGSSEFVKALAGVLKADSGEISLAGKPLRIESPADAIEHGICYISDDRKEEGLYLDMDIKSNCISPSLKQFSKGFLGTMIERKIRAFANSCREKYRIVSDDVDKKVRYLSGGNQQKVLLAMWIERHPSVLVIDEPTRGVDVGAKSEIYAVLRELTAQGARIIIKSSDLMEVLGLSDRIVVMRKGRVAAELEKDKATEEIIMSSAAGVPVLAV